MIYRLTTKEQFQFARHELPENMIGFTWNKSQFTLPTENEEWEKLPQDIVAIPNDRWENETAMIIERTENELKQLSELPVFLEQSGDVFVYQMPNGSNTFEIYGKTSQSEADAYVSELVNIGITNNLITAKNSKIANIKAAAASLLSATDYKVIRHRDETDGGLTTTLATSEYNTLITQRANIRELSNQFEAEVNALTTIEQVQEYTYTYNA